MEAAQRDRLKALLAQEHVAILVTQGEQWPTATMQAFAETPELETLFIMTSDSEKFHNLLARPHATVHVDARDHGDIPTFRIDRVLIQGLAIEVVRDSAEWERLKELFLKKNTFEGPFFNYPTLRMMRIVPKRLSFAGADRVAFKTEL
jgi:general stress protein 26